MDYGSLGPSLNFITPFWMIYRKDTEHLYHAFVYSLVILLSGIYPFNAMLSLLVTIILRYKYNQVQPSTIEPQT